MTFWPCSTPLAASPPPCSAWAKGLCLEGELARAEPKRLRYTLLHAAGVLVRSGRRTTLRIAEGWPWADALVAAFARLPGWSLTG